MVGDRSTIYQNFRIGTFEPSDQGTWLFLMEAKQMYLQLAKLSRCWPLTLLVKLAINCLDVNLRNLSLTCDLKLGLHGYIMDTRRSSYSLDCNFYNLHNCIRKYCLACLSL